MKFKMIFSVKENNLLYFRNIDLLNEVKMKHNIQRNWINKPNKKFYELKNTSWLLYVFVSRPMEVLKVLQVLNTFMWTLPIE